MLLGHTSCLILMIRENEKDKSIAALSNQSWHLLHWIHASKHALYELPRTQSIKNNMMKHLEDDEEDSNNPPTRWAIDGARSSRNKQFGDEWMKHLWTLHGPFRVELVLETKHFSVFVFLYWVPEVILMSKELTPEDKWKRHKWNHG